jgi:hypothetical protein
VPKAQLFSLVASSKIWQRARKLLSFLTFCLLFGQAKSKNKKKLSPSTNPPLTTNVYYKQSNKKQQISILTI